MFQSLMASNTFLLNPFFLLGTCQHVEPFQWNCFCDRQIGKEGTRCGTHSLRNKKLCSDLLTGTLSSATSANMPRIAMALDTDGKDMENRSPVTPQGLRFGQVKSETIWWHPSLYLYHVRQVSKSKGLQLECIRHVLSHCHCINQREAMKEPFLLNALPQNILQLFDTRSHAST